jgi:di/tricarboxylate transporter
LVLFATEKVPVDVITLVLLTTLVTTGVLSPKEAFEGFSSDIIIILGSVFVISAALRETGLLDAIGVRMLKVASGSPRRLLFLLMTVSGSISAFMNNTTVTAMLLSPVVGISKKTNIATSRLLIPLAYASMLGGTCTLIGTSTNVAVSGYLARSELKPLTLFEITPIGLVIMAAGIAYMIFVGSRLLPEHRQGALTRAYAMRDYLSEIVVLPRSPLIGQNPREWELSLIGFQLLKIIRRDEEILPGPDTAVEERDTLLVAGRIEDLMKVRTIEGIEIKASLDLDAPELSGGRAKVAEVLLAPKSEFLGRTLTQARFRERHGLNVLAIYRHGRTLHQQLASIRLRIGDILLVEGAEDRIEALRGNPTLAILDEHRPARANTRAGLYALVFFITAVTASALGVLPLSIAFLSAAVLVVLVGCITIEQARIAIDLQMLILIGGMTAFGTAMEKTGTADFMAHGILTLLAPLGIMAVLTGFLVVTILLTQPMSNAAAALVVLPVAISAAEMLGANPRTFAIGVMLAASISFIAPLEPSCALVYGPGKYRFADFVKTGAGLTFTLVVIVLALLPLLWPLHP